MNDIPQPLPDVPQLRTLLLTDLCDSTELVERLGDTVAAELFREHDTLVLRLQQEWRGRLIDRSDGLLLLFERPIDGLGFALDYQQGLRDLGHARGLRLLARAGLHVGEVLTWRNSEEAVQIGAKPLEVEGLAKPVAARLMTVARPGQILLSAVAESLTQRAARELGERGERLLWKSHGHWRFKGMPTRMEIYEVGEIGLTPLRAPKNSPKAWRDTPLWRRPAALAAEAAVLAVIAVSGWFFTRPEPAIAFAERDWVVVGDLRNMTGDSLLDDSLQQAFRISLEQSRYVNVMSDLKARNVMKLMRRDSAAVLDTRAASEVALRAGARLVVMPSVSEVGGRMRIAAEVIDPQTQRTLLVSIADGRGAQSTLSSIDEITSDLRVRMGEAPDQVRSSAPLPMVSTSSLDALKAYAVAQKRYAVGEYADALALFDEATKLDDAFALAWIGVLRSKYVEGDVRGGVDALVKALSLRDNLPARERMYVENWEKSLDAPAEATAAWQRMAALYPDYFPAQHNAAIALYTENRFKEAKIAAERAADPKFELATAAQDQLGRINTALGDYAGAERAFEIAIRDGKRETQRFRAASLASEGQPVDALKALDLVPASIYSSLERSTIAADSGNWEEAERAARKGMELTANVDGFDKNMFLLPLATAQWLGGNRIAASKSAKEAVARSLARIGQRDNPSQTDDAMLAAGSALLLLRMDESRPADEVRRALEGLPATKRARQLSELVAVLQAERLRMAHRPSEAIELLRPYLDEQARFQTRIVAYHAMQDDGRTEEAKRQAQWLTANRGWAYAELNCGYCMQSLNVTDVDALALRRAAASQNAGWQGVNSRVLARDAGQHHSSLQGAAAL